MSRSKTHEAPFPRRSFLKFGTLGLLAGAFRPASLFALPIDPRERRERPLLSIGYAENAPTPGASVVLKSASSVLSGDPVFISRGARVAIQSFARAAKYRGRPAEGAAIDVVYPALSYTNEKKPRFRAWSFSGRAEGDTFSGPISFDVPVTATDGLELVVRRQNTDAVETAENASRGRAVGSLESSATLTLGVDSRFAKLQRGVYVIAFRETDDDAINGWDLFRLSDQNGQFVLSPAPFTYVVLTIDYAT